MDFLSRFSRVVGALERMNSRELDQLLKVSASAEVSRSSPSGLAEYYSFETSGHALCHPATTAALPHTFPASWLSAHSPCRKPRGMAGGYPRPAWRYGTVPPLLGESPPAAESGKPRFFEHHGGGRPDAICHHRGGIVRAIGGIGGRAGFLNNLNP